MTELSIRQEMNPNGLVDEIAEKIERRVNQAALDKAASTLEEYGYVKVVRCRDCAYSIHFFHHDDERWQCAEPHQEGVDVKPEAYCWRGERKEGGDE